MFYTVVIFLSILAAGFVVWPLFRRPGRVPGVLHDEAVRDVYRERVGELAGETLDEDLRAEIETELGAVLLTEAQRNTGTQEATSGRRMLTMLLAAMIPLGSLSVYFSVADPELEQIRGAEEILTLANDDTVALESWARRLSERVEAASEDSMSWYLLGHARLKLGQFGSAAEAFATTNQLVENDLNIQVYWLQARYLAAKGVLDDMGRKLANDILEQQPGLSVVLEILALDAFRTGDGAQAVSLLNRALTSAGDIRQQASFATAIAQVRQGLVDPPDGVTVNVSADAAPSPHATVFVVARPVGGGMPFAVVKRPAFLLPFSVRLDDLVTMSPAVKLSDTAAFEVLVRLSESGNAMPQEGDWQWQSQPLGAVAEGLAALDAILTPSE